MEKLLEIEGKRAMNCNCIDELKYKLVGHEIDGSPILSADFGNQGLVKNGKNLTVKYYSVFDCNVEGRKRTVPMKIFHSYCPFCGKSDGDQSPNAVA